MSKNEILAAKNSPERFTLLLVRVEGEDATALHRVRHYEFGSPGFQQTRSSYGITGLLQHASSADG